MQNKIFLKRKLYILRMLESTSMIEHINTLKTLFSQLSTMEHNIEEKECVELLLRSLLDSYDHLIINMANGALRTMLVVSPRVPLSEEQVVGQLNVGVFFFLNKVELLIYRFLPSSTKNAKKQPKGFDFK